MESVYIWHNENLWCVNDQKGVGIPELTLVSNVKDKNIWASKGENLSSGVLNNKGVDQPAHSHSLISPSVFHVLESIISRLAARKISIF